MMGKCNRNNLIFINYGRPPMGRVFNRAMERKGAEKIYVHTDKKTWTFDSTSIESMYVKRSGLGASLSVRLISGNTKAGISTCKEQKRVFPVHRTGFQLVPV